MAAAMTPSVEKFSVADMIALAATRTRCDKHGHFLNFRICAKST
jgi:hypothetical protein